MNRPVTIDLQGLCDEVENLKSELQERNQALMSQIDELLFTRTLLETNIRQLSRISTQLYEALK